MDRGLSITWYDLPQAARDEVWRKLLIGQTGLTVGIDCTAGVRHKAAIVGRVAENGRSTVTICGAHGKRSFGS
jgi:hypothetical protein